MSEIPNYQPLKLPEPPAQQSTVERSVARDDAFSKPGSMGKGTKSKGWSPAKGIRFRPTHGKVPGRKRKHAKDSRSVTFY